MKMIGTCKVFSRRNIIYGYKKDTGYVLVKVYPNICNDFKEYDWVIYGISDINITEKNN